MLPVDATWQHVHISRERIGTKGPCQRAPVLHANGSGVHAQLDMFTHPTTLTADTRSKLQRQARTDKRKTTCKHVFQAVIGEAPQSTRCYKLHDLPRPNEALLIATVTPLVVVRRTR